MRNNFDSVVIDSNPNNNFYFNNDIYISESILISKTDDFITQTFKYISLIHDFIKSNIIPKSPFIDCQINRITDPEEFCDWEFCFVNDGSHKFKDLLRINDEIIDIIGNFCNEIDCMDVFDKIVFLI